MLQKILSRMRKAIEDYQMIKDGDHIAVGVSGGKDSLALLMGLKELQRFLPVQFELTAITLSLGFKDFDRDALIAFYERIGVRWHIEETTIGQVVFETRKESNPCSLCANMKRGTIHSTAKKLGCNKVAFGHHMDDAIGTLMMSLIYEGRLHCFSPVTVLDRSGITLIRPLIYTEEKMVRALMRKEGITPIKSGCPVDGGTKRQTVKDQISALKAENPDIKAALFGSIQRAGLNGWKPMGHSSQYKKGHPEKQTEPAVQPLFNPNGLIPGIDSRSGVLPGFKPDGLPVFKPDGLIPSIEPMPGTFPRFPDGKPRPRNPFPYIHPESQDPKALGMDSLYRSIIDLLPTAVCIARESDSALLYANRHAGVVFGRSPEEAFGFHTDESYVHPEDAHHVHEVLTSKGVIRDYEVQLFHPTGHPFWAMLSADLIRYGGEAARIFTVSRIDALKEMEDKLKRSHARQTLILGMLLQLYHPTDLGQSFINVLGLAGRYLDIDRASLFSYQHDGSLRVRQEWRTQRRPAPDHMLPHLADHRDKTLLHLGKWMMNRSRFYAGVDEPEDDESPASMPDIAHPWVAQTLRIGEKPTALLLFEDFRPDHAWSEDDMMTLDAIGFIMTMAHERRQTEIALHSATRKAQEANLTKSRFLANMSHELRTPMNAILGYMDLLDTTPLTEEQTDFVQEAKNASDILLYLINDVLDYSKIEAGHMTLETIRFDLRTCVENAVVLHAPRAQEKGVEIGMLIDPALPDTVMGDPVRLEQILSNLIGNAVKFTSSGDVLVEVLADPDRSVPWKNAPPVDSDFTSFAEDVFPYLANDEIPGQVHMMDPIAKEPAGEPAVEGEVSILLRITDSGIGMSRSTLARLYSPFTQADSSTTRQFGGTGLGLAITHRLVDMMHGSIAVESKEGAGTSFVLRLPFPLPTNTPHGGKGDSLSSQMRFRGDMISDEVAPASRILLAEGNRMQGFILERYLSNAGYHCTLVNSAVDALTQLSGQSGFDALLLSTTLADYPASAMVDIFRSMPMGTTLPILLLTTHTRRNSPAGKFGDRIQGTLTRPYRMNELLARLKQIHGNSHDGGTAENASIHAGQPDNTKVHTERTAGATVHADSPANTAGYDESAANTAVHAEHPANTTVDAAHPANAADHSERTEAGSDFPRPSILLVEDNPTNQIVFANMLRVYGLGCDIASDGQEAVNECAKKSFDIIFMDCQMPVLDGFAATRAIRAAGSDKRPRIVALTAHTLTGDRDRCLEAGMDDHIGKPVTMASLFERLDKMLGTLGFPECTRLRSTATGKSRQSDRRKKTHTEPNVSVSQETDNSVQPDDPLLAVDNPDAEMLNWLAKPIFTQSLSKLQAIPGLSRHEIIELIRLFLSELSETLVMAPQMPDEALMKRAHRQRGAAGSLHLDGFMHALALLETAAGEGDSTMIAITLEDLGRMHAQAVSGEPPFPSATSLQG